MAGADQLNRALLPRRQEGAHPFPLATRLRTHLLQQWFTLSDPGMEEAFFDVPLYREFAQLPEISRMPDESTILRFRHRLEKHKLAVQILAAVNDLLIERGYCSRPAPWSAKRSLRLPAPVRTTTKPATLRCTPAQRATSGTLAWPTLALTLTLFWCTRFGSHWVIFTMCSKATACCMSKKWMLRAMRVIKASTNVPMPSPA